MTPDALATLHAAAFIESRAWSAEEIADMIAGPGGFVVTRPGGFAIGRVIADEAELITIAVAPETQRRGTGRALLADFERGALARGADTAFLEVAADNAAACALYSRAGWRQTGRRAGYYLRPSGTVDAVTMAKPLAPETGGG
ncbi:GNAT family N-acetyltransferase [Sinisalibacter aestuarii]|uniref:Alanine acetyltransferase n=1 Tax=Sinisalibacter aestuarii TaxID=2949426 RepID=A0ABQ5LXN3_9RHOB|nr:GNAT family N-acetyltransferase [Sinisalibacter aestuarii]GKY89373.1 alanine acetyltransferase [Sinisalibacter aestuarii]